MGVFLVMLDTKGNFEADKDEIIKMQWLSCCKKVCHICLSASLNQKSQTPKLPSPKSKCHNTSSSFFVCFSYSELGLLIEPRTGPFYRKFSSSVKQSRFNEQKTCRLVRSL